MKKSSFRIIGIVALTGTLLAGGCSDSPETMLASAKDYLAKKDHAAATIQLKNVLAKNPDAAEARFLFGRMLLEGGDPVAAEIELRKALELKFAPDQVVPVLARALLAQGQTKKLDELAKTPLTTPEAVADLKTTVAQGLARGGKLAEAEAAFKEALAVKSDFAPAQLGMARLKIAARDAAGAHAIIDAIPAKTPDDANVWQFKADLLRAENKVDEAAAAYEKVLVLDAKSLAAHAGLITLHLREHKPELAGKQLEAMQQVAAKHPQTLYMQGLVAYTNKDLQTARSAVDNLLKLQPNNPQALQLAGLIAYASRADLTAQEYLRKALQKVPGFDLSRRVLALSYLRSGQPAKAVEILQPVLHGNETQPAWLALAGNAYLQNGDTKTAEDYFQRAVAADPANTHTKTALALTHLRGGRSEEAFAELEHISAEDSGVTADMALIATNLRMRQFDKALKEIDRFEKKQPDNPVAHNLRGLALLGKNDRDGARKNFEQALSLNPAYLPAATALAQLDLAAKQPDAARQRFESVLAKEPKNIQAMLALAELGSRTGAKPDETASLIGKAIATDPDNPASRLALIKLHIAHQDYKKALNAAQEALAALPERPEILDIVGQVYRLNGDTNQALATYNKLTALLPSAIYPYLRMAEIQAGSGDKQGARTSLNKGLALQPDSLVIQRALIMLDVDDKQFDAALAKARDIQKALPKRHVGYLLEGDIHMLSRALGQAVAAFRAGLKAEPTTELAERLHAALLQDGKPAEAATAAADWLKAHPGDSAFRLYLADSANRRQDYAAAVAQYRSLLAGAPDNPLLLNNLAWSLGQMKDPKALSYAEKANRLAPNQPPIMDTLGTLLVEQGDTERGLELLTQAVRQMPQAGAIRLNLAKALIKAGKKEQAKQELETLAKLGDRFPAQAEVAALSKGL